MISDPATMSRRSDVEQNSIIALLYHWGARFMGTVLLAGIAIQITGVLTGANKGQAGGLAAAWPHIALVGLWLVPVVCVTISGCVWVARDIRHSTGWIAIGIGVFLSSLWILK